AAIVTLAGRPASAQSVDATAPAAPLATIVVNDAGDALHSPGCATTGTGACTLRDAITFANSNAGADTIDLRTDVTLTSILPNITSDITINGNDHTIARAPGAAEFRILSVAASANFTLNRATLANGIANGRSGGP